MHKVATLFSLTQDSCQKWESLRLGKGSTPFALSDSHGLESEFLSVVVLLGWFLVLEFGLVLLVVFVRLIPRIRLGDLCLSAHTAPYLCKKNPLASRCPQPMLEVDWACLERQRFPALSLRSRKASCAPTLVSPKA